jgi:AhpD family alkylhydroperoxidase
MITGTTIPQPRMKNPAALLPEATKAIQALVGATMQGGVPPATLALVHVRASQINGCSFCVDAGAKHAKQGGESDERLNDAERAALALSESVTRLSDRADPVPDAIWDEATRHYDERQLAALILWIATTNVFNRMNVSTRQPAGAGW